MADQCLVVALVARFDIVVGCGLGMRSMLWWLLGLVHVFSLSFSDCFFRVLDFSKIKVFQIRKMNRGRTIKNN